MRQRASNASRFKEGPRKVARTAEEARAFAKLMARAINKRLPIAVDTEFDPDTHRIVLMSFAWDETGYVVYGEHVVRYFGQHLSNPQALFVYQNFAADADVFENLGLEVRRSFHADVMVMGWLHDENLLSHTLKDQCVAFLHWRRTPYERLFAYVPVGKKRPVTLTPSQVVHSLPGDALTQAVVYWPSKKVPPKLAARTQEAWLEVMLAYSADDASSTIALYYHHRRYLEKIGYWQTYVRDDREFTLDLMLEEERGVKINQPALRIIQKRVQTRIMRSTHVFRKLVGKPNFNMNSIPQYKQTFLTELKWPTRDDLVTEKGHPALDKVALNWYQEEFYARHKRAEKLCRYGDARKYRSWYTMATLKQAYQREATKLGTFINGILSGLNPETGRLHSHLNQIGTDTGRISSRKQRKKIQVQHTLKNGTIKLVEKTVKVGANVQNIPSRAEKDPDGIRRVFEAPRVGDITAYGYVAQEDYELIVADYSGFELCMAIFWLSEIGQHSSLMLKTMMEQGSPSAVHALTAIGMYSNEKPTVTEKNKHVYDTVLAPKYGVDMRLKHIKMTDWKLVKLFWPDFYSSAKNGNFNLLYGGSAKMMASLRFQDVRDPDVLEENQAFIDSWNNLYPEITEYQNHMVSHGYRKGWVPTISGWRAHVADLLKSSDRKKQSYGERKCMNTPCQGSAANIVKKAMILIENDECLKDTRSKLYIGKTALEPPRSPRFRFEHRLQKLPVERDARGFFVMAPCVAQLFPVHDEIVVEAPKKYGQQVQERMVYLMKKPYRHRMPFELDVEAFRGSNWLDAKLGN